MIKINQLHSDQLEEIKNNNDLFDSYVREALHHEDYDQLEDLMNIINDKDHTHLDHDIIKDILHNKDYKALKIIIKANLSTHLSLNTSYEGDARGVNEWGTLSYIMKKSVKRLDLEAINILLEETLDSKLSISSFNIYKHLEIDDLGDIIKKEYYKQYSATKAKEIVKTFVAAIHKQDTLINKKCFKTTSDGLKKCETKIHDEKDSKLLSESDKMKNIIKCLEEETTKQQNKEADESCKMQTLAATDLKELSHYLTKEEFDAFIEEQKIENKVAEVWGE